jgi:hypothetical protein
MESKLNNTENNGFGCFWSRLTDHCFFLYHPGIDLLGLHENEGRDHLFAYLMFLIIASRIYEPVNEVFNNLASLFILDIRINRMNEMEALPIQTGNTKFKPERFDIVFDRVYFSYETGKPGELKMRNGVFAKMVERQMAGAG